MKLSVSNPNLSVIMPVGCNAKCKFCYWEPGCGLTLERFKFIAETLPKQFSQCSITGGEPTLHNELCSFIDAAKNRFDKVVLNTNGHELSESIVKKCDFVNISRHHFDEDKNRSVFGCSSVPTTDKIKKLCKFGDVTLNCFLPPSFSDNYFISKYIEYAKSVGAKVAFRKYYSDLSILEEVDKKDTLIGEHSCGACLHRWHKINGVEVTFKYSVQETFENMDGIYELIVQPNGDLTFDWQGKNKLIYKEAA